MSHRWKLYCRKAAKSGSRSPNIAIKQASEIKALAASNLPLPSNGGDSLTFTSSQKQLTEKPSLIPNSQSKRPESSKQIRLFNPPPPFAN